MLFFKKSFVFIVGIRSSLLSSLKYKSESETNLYRFSRINFLAKAYQSNYSYQYFEKLNAEILNLAKATLTLDDLA